MDIRNAVVWVTGASSGIGHATVAPLVKAGARVIVTARRRKPLEALVAEFGDDKVRALPGDLMDANALDDLHQRALTFFGVVDVLINNAGRTQRRSALTTPMEEVRDLMELNFMAPVALTKRVVPKMIERGLGHVVIVSSVAGYVSTPMRSSYCASKFAVRGWFDALRAELHGSNVGVSVIVPGYIKTDIIDAALSEPNDPKRPIAKGRSADHCARLIVKAIKRNQMEVHVGGKELAGIHLARWMPALLRRMAHKLSP